MKVTPYFANSVLRRRPYVSVDLCASIIANPVKTQIQTDGRIRCWGRVDGRWLRVVIEGDAVHNAFFDRGFKL